jgi:hypothetical protein
MDGQARLTTLETRQATNPTDTSSTASELGELKREIFGARGQFTSLRGSLATAKLLILLLLLLVLSVAALAIYVGKPFAKDLIREAVQSEVRGQTTLIQYSYFSNLTKISDNPLTFEWKLKQPINMNQVVAITAEPLAFVPGVSIEAHIKDGKVCRIVFSGTNNSFLELLENGVQGKITITLKTD